MKWVTYLLRVTTFMKQYAPNVGELEEKKMKKKKRIPPTYRKINRDCPQCGETLQYEYHRLPHHEGIDKALGNPAYIWERVICLGLTENLEACDYIEEIIYI